jgi:hypothetical protein
MLHGKPGDGAMICRIWRGYTTLKNAPLYEEIVRNQVIPGIEAMAIRGFRHIDLLCRNCGAEVEFTTLMWFDGMEDVRAFVGEDVDVSHVPAAARAVLSRFDERVTHSEVIDRRPQTVCSKDRSH